MPTGGDWIYVGPPRVRLNGLDASAFQHPDDREAILQLRRLGGFDAAFKRLNELSLLRVAYVVNIASNLRVGPRQLPTVYALLREACSVLDVPEPELYVSQGNGAINAFTFGYERPYVVLTTDLVDSMTDDELLCVIGHELGHVKCGHVHYTMMLQMFKWLSETAGNIALGIGALVSLPLQQALWAWQRRAELSCDRSALLTVQQPRPCITMLMKLAGGTKRLGSQLDPAEFLRQARALSDEVDRSSTDRIYRIAAGVYEGSHPFVVERTKALSDWIDGGRYLGILAGDYPRAQRASGQYGEWSGGERRP